MKKYSEALKIISFFVILNVAIGFVFRSFFVHFFPSYFFPTVRMWTIALQLALMLAIFSKKYRLNFHVRMRGLGCKKILGWGGLSIVFVAPAIVATFFYGGGEFRTEFAPVSMEHNKGLFLLALVYAEELIFRGFLLGVFIPILGARGAIVLQAILFSVYHFTQIFGLSDFLFRAYMGCILGYVTFKFKSIFPSVLIHLMWNACIIVFSAFDYGLFGESGASVLGVYIISSKISYSVVVGSSVVGGVFLFALIEHSFRSERVDLTMHRT